MAHYYPTPQQLGIKIPPHLRENRYNNGFLHALKGKHLTEVEHLRLSFREGYRMGKLYLRALRKQMGIIDFPMKAKVKFKAAA